MTKNIIISFGIYGVGGAQRRAANIANHLANNGYNVTIVALQGTNGSISDSNYYDLNPCVKLIVLPDDFIISSDEKIINKLRYHDALIRFYKKVSILLSYFHITLNSINRRINTIRKAKYFRSFLACHKSDTIIHFGFLTFPYVYFSKYNNKIIYAETNSIEKYKDSSEFDSIKKMISSADALVFQTAEEIKEHGLSLSGKNYVIHNPIKSNLPEPYQGRRQKIITNFCAIKPHKNLLLLLNSFLLVSREFNDFSLYLYVLSGHDNQEDVQILNDFINSNNLNEKVKLLPLRRDIHSVIRDYSMFVCSSDYEGISNSMLEAMAIGLPVICTDCSGGGAREFIDNKENGLLVPKNDVIALYNAIKTLITNQDLANKCSQNAVKIKETLSDDIIYGQWLDLINKVA